jgi:biotin carboxylase
VVKPLSLSASRGVIRADDAGQFVAAFRRVAAIIQRTDIAPPPGAAGHEILVEGFIPGSEVALEGLLSRGDLRVLALYDKPDPLDGPFFEETIYVTPSRLSTAVQEGIVARTAAVATALGLREGPVHAELRVNAQGPWLLEIAPRSIGGLCSRTLRFGPGITLEELIVRHALARDVASFEREREAAGVMMIPIPRAGILREVFGQQEARKVPGVEDLRLTIPPGQEVVPLPEGSKYLGFIFARDPTPEGVEAALREAHRRLTFHIVPPEASASPSNRLSEVGPSGQTLRLLGRR